MYVIWFISCMGISGKKTIRWWHNACLIQFRSSFVVHHQQQQKKESGYDQGGRGGRRRTTTASHLFVAVNCDLVDFGEYMYGGGGRETTWELNLLPPRQWLRRILVGWFPLRWSVRLLTLRFDLFGSCQTGKSFIKNHNRIQCIPATTTTRGLGRVYVSQIPVAHYTTLTHSLNFLSWRNLKSSRMASLRKFKTCFVKWKSLAQKLCWTCGFGVHTIPFTTGDDGSSGNCSSFASPALPLLQLWVCSTGNCAFSLSFSDCLASSQNVLAFNTTTFSKYIKFPRKTMAYTKMKSRVGSCCFTFTTFHSKEGTRRGVWISKYTRREALSYKLQHTSKT